MQIFSRTLTLAGFLLVLACPLSAPAETAKDGVRFTVEFTSNVPRPTRTEMNIWISKHRLRIEQVSLGPKSKAPTMIYRGDLDRLYSLNASEKAYIAIDRSLITQLGLELKAARREMNAQLARLPRDQRAAFERILGVNGAHEQKEQAAIKVQETKVREVYGRHTCKVVNVQRDENETGRACVVPYESIGLSRGDLEVFRQLANFQRELMGAKGFTPMEIVPNQPLDVLVQFDGFPLYFHRYEDGEIGSSIRVLESARIAAAEDLFSVPDDYKLRGAFDSLLAERGGALPPSPAARSRGTPPSGLAVPAR